MSHWRRISQLRLGSRPREASAEEPRRRSADPIEPSNRRPNISVADKYTRSIDRERDSAGKHDWDKLAERLRDRGQFVWFREIEADLGEGRVRVRGTGEMLMLSGYSYLGLNARPEIAEACEKAMFFYGTGTHGSRWLAGHTSLHEELESMLAARHDREDAVLFGSGYAANTATLSALLARTDTVFTDRMNHASIIDGCRFSGARVRRFRHCDYQHLDKMLSQTMGTKLVAIDGVFSMSGSIAPLPEIAAVCRRHDATLMVDECHSHFVLGGGRGTAAHYGLASDRIDVEMGTLSKAIPSSGGYIAASAEICTRLRRSARSFVYSGSPPPVVVAASIAALRILENELPVLLDRLRINKRIFTRALSEAGVDFADHPTPIVPIKVGPAMVAAAAASHCHARGLFIHPVFPPVVETGKSILRVGVMASHDPHELRSAAFVIAEAIDRAREEISREEAISV